MAALVSPAPPVIEADPIWRMSVDQYHAMIDAGILGEDTPVELVEGFLLEKMAKNPPHSFVNEELQAALAAVVPEGWCVKAQNPITLLDSEPEPDVVVARGTRRDYRKRHPGPAEIAIVVEVADASLRRDRSIKRRVYARAGIREYWIVDLINRRVEVYSQPSGEAYRSVAVLTVSDKLPVLIEGAEVGTIQVAQLFE